MKINLLTAGALIAALAMPLAAYAQQSPQQPTMRQHHRTTPSGERMHHRWMKRLGRLNLSGDQQQRIGSMIDQYSQSHPAGSPQDRNANRALRQQILGVLSSDQQNQYRQEMQARRGHRHGHGQTGAGEYQGQGPQGQYQQGPYQGQQGPYQQGPYQQQYGEPRGQQQPPSYMDQGAQGPPQQGPPDQGPPQQGPPNQGPPYQAAPDQGPPQDQGPPEQGPPDQQPPA